MSTDTVFQIDVAIVGTGQAAPALAVALAGRGETVVLFEQALVGGSCVNVGCTPTKTLRKSARVAHQVQTAALFGVHVSGMHIDFNAAMTRMQERVEASRGGVEKSLTGTSNVSLVRAHGVLDGRAGERFVVRAGTQRWHSRRVYLNTGTRAAVPPIVGLADIPWLDNVGLLQLRQCPRHLVIVGGSVIGLEMGQIFRRLGAEVTILETSSRVAAREDADVAERIAAMLRDEGIVIHTGVTVQQASRSPQPANAAGSLIDANATAASVDVVLRVKQADATLEVRGSHLLIATGRKPNTEDLGLASVGLKTDQRGLISTDGQLATAVPGIWALGDINGRGAFTHTSYQDHEIVLANLKGEPRTADGRVTTYAMFTDPPIGRVGLSETEARTLMRDKGRRFLLATHDMKDVSRAKEEGETIGLIKIVVDADDGRIAGACVFGIGGDEVIQVLSSFMATGARFEVLRDALPVHPTVAEFLPTVLHKLLPLA